MSVPEHYGATATQTPPGEATDPPAEGEALLELSNLSVRYVGAESSLQAISNVSLTLAGGEVLGVVGESGSGKSTLARAILRLLPRGSEISGEIELAGRDLRACSKREFRRVRWAEISMVFQDAMNALNPVLRVGNQLVETIRLHEKVDKKTALARSGDMLEAVGLDRRVLKRYPHELSGGMRQRVCIAMAFSCSPRLVLADEPTTALDVITQDRVVEEMLNLQKRSGQAMIFISHDIALVSEVSDKLGVMYSGHLVEHGSTAQTLQQPSHPYTMGLLNAFPRADIDHDVVSIPGFPAKFEETPSFCAFVDRCPFAQPICREQAPPPVAVGPGHWAACHFADQAAELRVKAEDPTIWRPEPHEDEEN